MTFQAAWPAITAAEVPPAEIPGHAFRILADGGRTGGAYSLTEATSPRGAAVGWHAHDTAVECFYVTQGRYRLTVSGAGHDLGPGDFSLVPPAAPHGFEVLEGDARALVLFAPAGFETVFRRMPEIFGTPGEPGPIFEAANRAAATRLLDRCGPGPAALVRPAGGPASPASPASPGETVLAEPADTRTRLRVVLRQDAAAGGGWRFDPSATTVVAVSGGYLIDLPGRSGTLRPGQMLAARTVPGETATARALEAGSRALLLHLDHGGEP